MKTSKKEIILESAKNLFAEKGYDVASMDEIALQSGVPKSLIYYHYKNKEKLLQAVVDKFFTEYEILLRDENTKELDNTQKYFDFLDNNSDILRVILIESLKKNKTILPLFRVVKLLLQYESELTGDKDLEDYTITHGRWVTEFFTSIIPSALFVCYKEEWSSFFGTDIKILEQDFFSAYKMTHGEYHKNFYKEK